MSGVDVIAKYGPNLDTLICRRFAISRRLRKKELRAGSLMPRSISYALETSFEQRLRLRIECENFRSLNDVAKDGHSCEF
ncbi:hypothetical protein FB472_0051 [Rhodoglobus vestalii]|uniref:Uncharacterized protein n=1 Tax=Rhodoglobus vestalii TaxID=193384 RepID=A0A8H2PWP8_9MICO|nr:hypothetical protein FB472_0051 [Rhodoglobus vestalii]